LFALSNLNYLPVIVPALGLLVPFVIRWIENKSRLRKARHLLDVIKTRNEISGLLEEAEERDMRLPHNEKVQLQFYALELEKEISQTQVTEIRLYPILISLEIIFFVSALFSGALTFLQKLVYAQGNETLPFLEGIFSNPSIRLVLLIFCLLSSLYLTYMVQKKLVIRLGYSFRTELRIFGIFNLFFAGILLALGMVLYLLDLVIPWF
jgi:hypothetical protein